MKKTLILEIVAATPHTETGIELALLESLNGSKVTYCPIYLYLSESFWNTPVNGNELNETSHNAWLIYTYAIIGKLVQVYTFTQNQLEPPNILQQQERQYYDSLQIDEIVKRWPYPMSLTENGDTSGMSILAFYKNLKYSVLTSLHCTELLIQQIKPDEIIIFNGRIPTAWPTYKLGKYYGIPVSFHERGSNNRKYVVLDEPVTDISGWQKLISPHIHRPFRSLRLGAGVYYRNRRLGISNTFGQFSKGETRNTDLKHPKIDSGEYAVFYTTSNYEIDQVPPLDNWYEVGKSQREIVMTLLELCFSHDILLVIRVHPNERFYPSLMQPSFEQASDEKFFTDLNMDDRCLIVSSDSNICSYGLGEKAAFRFSIGSSISWELMYAGYPVAVLSKSLGSGFRGVIELKTVEDIVNYITNSTSEVDKTFPLAWADFQTTYGEEFVYFESQDNNKLLILKQKQLEDHIDNETFTKFK